ncbi:MAG: multidrug ABC transporter permease [Gemmatimonadetes bacterium]|nr:MAG: multidrug ABC transporter permease [Gemmatimonadota bacterium]
MNLNALRAFVVKELHHILRDRQTLTVLLMMPLVQVILFGYALRSDVRDIRMAIVDPTPDNATLELQSRFLSTMRFRIVATGQSTDIIEPLFRRDKADVALVFDPDFASHLRGTEPARLLIAIDASDPNTGTTYLNYTRAVIQAYQAELSAGSNQVRIVTETRMRFNPTLESVNLFVPGLIALVLVLVSALMTAISLSREKERGTMEVLLVSPLRPQQIIVGKVLPYLVLAFANVLTALLAAWAVFHVPFRGSVVLLLLESILYTLVSLALGVLVAAKTASQRAAMLTAMLATMLPNALLSGMIFPIASMPRWLLPVTYVVPARWFIVIARGIMLKGVGLGILWRETLVLSAMALLLLVAAMRSFKPRME